MIGERFAGFFSQDQTNLVELRTILFYVKFRLASVPLLQPTEGPEI